jgi:hypothetical protein
VEGGVGFILIFPRVFYLLFYISCSSVFRPQRALFVGGRREEEEEEEDLRL